MTDEALVTEIAKMLYNQNEGEGPDGDENDLREYWREDARAILRALQTHPRWRVVPVEATDEMKERADAQQRWAGDWTMTYQAMLAAAPKPVGDE